MADFTNIAVGDKIWTERGAAEVVRVTRTQFTAMTSLPSKHRFRKSDGRAVDGWGGRAREWTEKRERIFNLEKIIIESSRKVYGSNVYYRYGIDKSLADFAKDIGALTAAIDALRELRELRDA